MFVCVVLCCCIISCVLRLLRVLVLSVDSCAVVCVCCVVRVVCECVVVVCWCVFDVVA